MGGRTSSRDGVVHQFLERANRDPEAVALVYGKRRVRYGELDRLTSEAAAYLSRRGVAEAEGVALVAPNSPAWVIAYLGILRAGGVVVAIDAGWSDLEVARAASAGGARLVLAPAARLSTLRPTCMRRRLSVRRLEDMLLAEVRPVTSDTPSNSPSDPACVLFTTGVAGPPKAVQLTHRNLAAAAADFSAEVAGLTPHDVVAAALPLSHALGLTLCLNAALHAGSSVALLARLEPAEALRRLGGDGVTVLPGTPAIYRGLVHAARHADLGDLRLSRCFTSGAMMPPSLVRAAEDALDCAVLEGYGISETAGVCAFHRTDGDARPGSAGPPMPGAEIEIVDDARGPRGRGEVGEIVVAGDYVMAGYLDGADSAAALCGGRLHTGDLGRIDEDGALVVMDRKEQVIAVSEGQVYPSVVEHALGRHPAVKEAAVLAVAGPEDGTEVGAAVVLRDAFEIAPESLRAHVRAQLPAHACPRRIWFVDRLPHATTGTVLKRELEVPLGVSRLGAAGP